MAPLAGKPLLEHLFERLHSVRELDDVVLATSTAAENQVLVELAEQVGVGVLRGDEDDVLGRYVAVARRWSADHVVRVTGDNPLTDLDLVRDLTRRQLGEKARLYLCAGRRSSDGNSSPR